MKLNNSLGISIIETLIALSMLVGLAMTSSYILTNTNVIKNKASIKATIDQIHVLQLQRARSSDLIKFSDIDHTIEMLSPQRKTCFDGSRTGFNGTEAGCNLNANIPQDWTTALPLALFSNSNFSMFGEATLFESKAVWKANCPNDKRCNSIDVKITTQVNLTSASSGVNGLAVSGATDAERKLEPRVSIISFPAQFFVNQSAIKFDCTGGPPPPAGGTIATSVSNIRNRATCVPFASAPAETSCANQYPMRNFGDIITSATLAICNVPANIDCSGGSDRGYRQINFDSKSCRNR